MSVIDRTAPAPRFRAAAAGARAVAVTLLCAALFACGCGCDRGDRKGGPAAGAGGTPVNLTLDWKPEPEFGGFYEARRSGAFARHGLDVKLRSAGEGFPTWQLVATGKTEFATTAADQLLIARSKGEDLVAVFAAYQTFPQGVMVHMARGFTKLEDIFTHDGTLAAEGNATWLAYLRDKYAAGGPLRVKLVAYAGGVGAFLARPDWSQQCFVTSEPLLAAAQGSDPQTFLIADAGYNPYTTVVICKGELARTDPAKVKAMALACREGWRAYLDDPAPANGEMGRINRDMDARTFEAAAKAQAPLIETDQTRKTHLGVMTAERWGALAQQLLSLKVIEKPIPAEACFVDVDKMP